MAVTAPEINTEIKSPLETKAGSSVGRAETRLEITSGSPLVTRAHKRKNTEDAIW